MSPLKFITISELKHDAKKFLEEVNKTGKKIVVTLNGKPIAVIGPAPEEDFEFQPKKK
jgi:prevent-host-death family protein